MFFSFEISRDEYISIGKNTSFICSQMDSLTGVKSPAITFLFVHSYRKCESVFDIFLIGTNTVGKTTINPLNNVKKVSIPAFYFELCIAFSL